MRGRTFTALAAAAFLAAGAAACGETRREYREDFSDPERDLWAQERTESAVLEYADGRYRITVLRPGERQLSTSALPARLEAVRIEVEVFADVGAGEQTLYGVACGAGDETRYFLGVNRLGTFAIEKARGEAPIERLTRARIRRGFGSPVRVAVECRVVGTDVSLILEVQRQRITGRLDEDADVAGFDRVSLFVVTPNPRTAVEFDNLLVRQL